MYRGRLLLDALSLTRFPRFDHLPVLFADSVHVDQVGGAYCAGRGTGHDDDLIALVVPTEGQQCLVDLLTIASVVATASTRNVSVPQRQRQLAAHLGIEVKASNGSVVCRRANRRTVSPDWVNATEAFASRRSPMSRAA